MLGELDGVDAGSARGRPGGGRRERGSKLCIRMLRRKRQVPRTQLLVADEARELQMELAPFVRPRPTLRRGSEQRVERSHPVPVDEEQPGVERLLDNGGLCDRRDPRQAEIPAQGDGKQQPSHRLRERIHARAQEVLDRLRHRDVLPDGRRPARGQGASQLEREERVSERRLVEPAQEVPGEAEPQPLGEHPPRSAEAERTDLETLQPPPRERLLQRGGTPGTLGEQKPNRLVLEPPRGERERLGRRRIEPLDVVDRHEHRPASRQRPQRVQEAERDRSRLRRDVRRLGAQERDLQRTQLRRRQRSQLFAAHAVEKVDQRREGEPRLRPARPSGEDAQPPLPRRSHSRLPERRLPDPRPTRQNERPWRSAGADELVQHCDLRFATDDARAQLSPSPLHGCFPFAHSILDNTNVRGGQDAGRRGAV